MPPGKNQDRIKDYSGWRYGHVDEETIIENGKATKALIYKSHPDIDSINDDIRKQPLSSKEHPRALRRGMPQARKK